MASLRAPLFVAAVLVGATGNALAGEELPKGPPWHTDYESAKREALREGRPVFLYFTKTY